MCQKGRALFSSGYSRSSRRAIGANGNCLKRTSRLGKWATALFLPSCLFFTVILPINVQAQFAEIGPAPISPAGAHQQIKELLRTANASNRQQIVTSISKLLSWYRDVIDEELSAAWQGDERANLPEIIERLADPDLAASIIAYSWRQARQTTFVPAYAHVLGLLMAHYPSSAEPFLDDLLGPVTSGQPAPDLTEVEAETVCRILMDMPDNANWRANTRQILRLYRSAAEALLARDLRGGDPEKNSMAQYWMGQLNTPASVAGVQRRVPAAPSRVAPPPASPSDDRFGSNNRPTLALNSPAATPAASENQPSPQSIQADDALAAARAAALSRASDPPGLLVQQTATRYQVARNGNNPRMTDLVTAELYKSGDKMEYRNVKLNGRSTTQRPQDLPGSWSSDQFGLVKEILLPATSASFVARGKETVANRTAWIFDFSVEQTQSSWTIQAEGRSYKPAYSGTLVVDTESPHIVRAEMHAIGIPADFPMDKAGEALEFDYREMGGRSWLVPVRGVSESCNRGSECNRTATEFSNYRADSMPVTKSALPATPAAAHGGVVLTALDPALVDDTYRSVEGKTPAAIEFVNRSRNAVDIYWIDYQGERNDHPTVLAAGATHMAGGTYLTHPFLVVVAGTGGTTAQDTGVRLAAFEAVTPNINHDPAIRDTAIITNPDGTTEASANPAPTPPGPGTMNPDGTYNIGNGVSQPAKLNQAAVEYSEEASAFRYGGIVMLFFTIDQAGIARDIKVQKSLGMGLDEKAIENLRKWQFKPAMKDGIAVAVHASAEIPFREALDPGR